MKRLQTHRSHPRGVALVAAVACLLAGPAVGRALADEAAQVLVVEDDGAILQPPTPLSLAGRSVRFVREADGGYRSALGESDADPATWRRGTSLDFSGPAASLAVTLPFSFPFFDGSYDEIFIHQHGAASLGRALPASSRAQAAASSELLRTLTAGPPVVAALWNELYPGHGGGPGGVHLDVRPDRVSISWLDVPSARPAGEPNSFRMTLHEDGRIDLEYAAMPSRWGIAGIAPGRDAEQVELVDLAAAPRGAPGQAILAWYRDLPTLNEIALARAVYRQLPDRFHFLTVFTNQAVDGPSLVGSMPVKNADRGIGLPLFDHGALFGTRNLEHIVVMNDLAFYDEDPARPPRHPGYAFAPSTLAVLAHETGHRWLAEASCSAAPLAGGEGHWSFFLHSNGSFLGGNRLRDNADGTFTTEQPLQAFGPLDQYLMGLRPPEEVAPFFVVDEPSEFEPPRSASGQAFSATSKPEAGVRFRGKRRAITIADVVAATGERSPRALRGPRTFRMLFVLLASAGAPPSSAELAKLESIRRGFGPYFERATDGRARLLTTLPRTLPPAAPEEDLRLRAGEPRILDAELRPRGNGRLALKLEFADFDADLTGVELTTDAGGGTAPTLVDVAAAAYGSRRGALVVNVRGIAEEAHEIRLALVDRRGQRSPVVVRPLRS